jgi:hypothetical protein
MGGCGILAKNLEMHPFQGVAMSSGPWIPISKELVSALPKTRPYTRLEAMYSLTVDYDNGEQATIKGYADLWRWSRGKVERFLAEVGAKIMYPEDTSQKQNQRGQIMIQMTSGTRADFRQIKMIDSKWLSHGVAASQADSEQTAGRAQGTTIYPYPNPHKKHLSGPTQSADSRLFSDWFCWAFETVEGDRYHFEGGKDGKLLAAMLKSVGLKELVCKACHFLVDEKRFPPGRPTLSLLKAAINKYPGHVNGKTEQYRQMGILPPDGIQLEDWRPWESREFLTKPDSPEKT